MKRKLCFLTYLIYLLFCVSPTVAQTLDYNLCQPDMEVNSFIQDKDGYVWIGTSHGLSRFNGSGYLTWTASNEEGGLQNDNIMSLLYEDCGRMWVGTECGLCFMEEGFVTHTGEAVYNPVTSIHNMGEEHVLLLGKDGLIKFRKADMQAVDVYSSLGTSWLEDVLVTDEQEVWFISPYNDSTYVNVLDSNLSLKAQSYMGMNIEVSGLCQLPDGDVYMASSVGVGRYDHETGTVVEVAAMKSCLSGTKKIHFMLPYRGNQLLFGIAGKGFFAYVPEDNSIRHVIKQQTLSDEEYVCFVDREDRIWLSDRKSAIRTYNPKGIYIHFNPQGEDKYGETSHLYFDNEGYLWINQSGVITCMDSLTGTIISQIEDESACRVSFIDSKGRLWGVFGQNEIRRYDLQDGKARLSRCFYTEDGVFTISEGSNGRMWFTSVRKIYHIDNDDMMGTFIPAVEPAFSMLLSEQFTHRVFMFTVNDGLYEIHDDMTVSKVETGGVKGISYVMSASDGSLWIGTYNEGVIRLDETTGALTRIHTGLPDLSIKSIVEDKDGNIWFSTRSNVVKYNISEGSLNTVHDDWFVEGRSYALVSAVCGPDGIIYFGGSAGITRIDPEIPFPEVVEKHLDIHQVIVGGKQIQIPDDQIILPHDHGMLNIRFAGLDYDSGPYLTYSYMLEGRDKNWTYVYGDGSAVYTYLPAGKYVFHARVKGFDGVWSRNEITLPVIVKRKPMSALLAVALILSFLSLVVLMVFLWKRQKSTSAESSEDNDQEKEFYDTSSFNEADKTFISKVVSLLEENLDSEKFTVNDLASMMSMSYSSLYAKMKSLTEETPQQFMTAYRMRKAETFLKSGLFSVSEVAYKVGSSSPMTFSREFKKYFGYPPSTLLKDKTAVKESNQNM